MEPAVWWFEVVKVEDAYHWRLLREGNVVAGSDPFEKRQDAVDAAFATAAELRDAPVLV